MNLVKGNDYYNIPGRGDYSRKPADEPEHKKSVRNS